MRSSFPYVGIDNAAAGRDVADYCLSQGWQDIAVIHASLVYSAGRERLQGFLDRLQQSGKGLHPVCMHQLRCEHRLRPPILGCPEELR